MVYRLVILYYSWSQRHLPTMQSPEFEVPGHMDGFIPLVHSLSAIPKILLEVENTLESL